MVENMKSKAITNWIFASIVLVIILVLIVVNQIGKKQDNVFLEDYQQYQYAVQLLYEEKAEEAVPILERLIDTYPNSFFLLWYQGLSFAMLGENEQAIEYMQMALKERPFLIMEQYFSHQLGEIYYNHQDFEKAKVYLEHTLTLPTITDEQRNHIEQLFQNMEIQMGIEQENGVE